MDMNLLERMLYSITANHTNGQAERLAGGLSSAAPGLSRILRRRSP